jgi:hypothetical protein
MTVAAPAAAAATITNIHERDTIDAEHDGHVQIGRPLHADVTAFLFARGADPLRPCNGMTVIAEAQTHGHWLAAEIMRAWTGRQE